MVRSHTTALTGVSSLIDKRLYTTSLCSMLFAVAGTEMLKTRELAVED